MKARTLLLLFFGITLFCSTAVIALEYSMPPLGDDLVGQNFYTQVRNRDSVSTIRKRYEVSYNELLAANPGVNFYKLKVGQRILIPQQTILPTIRRGIVINIPELRLYFFTADGNKVYTFPVGLGRIEWRTPLADATVVRKKEDPTWHVPKSIHDYVLDKTGESLPDEVPPGPDNPLGKYALYLSKTGYMIHGTNAPDSVGTFISSGCMRLLREPIEFLYQEVQVGTPVHIMYAPNKAGWQGNNLYLESHAQVNGYEEITFTPELIDSNAQSAIYTALHLRPAAINWDKVQLTIQHHTGMPEVIGKRDDMFDS